MLIWSEIAVFFAAVIVNVMIAKNQQSLLPIPTLAGAAINIGLNLMLIPRYAAMGAACATLISYTVAWMVVLLFIGAMRPLIWQGLRFALPVAGLALIAIGCARLMSSHAVLRFVVASGVFVAAAGATNYIRKSDVKDMLQFLRAVPARIR